MHVLPKMQATAFKFFFQQFNSQLHITFYAKHKWTHHLLCLTRFHPTDFHHDSIKWGHSWQASSAFTQTQQQESIASYLEKYTNKSTIDIDKIRRWKIRRKESFMKIFQKKYNKLSTGCWKGDEYMLVCICKLIILTTKHFKPASVQTSSFYQLSTSTATDEQSWTQNGVSDVTNVCDVEFRCDP